MLSRLSPVGVIALTTLLAVRVPQVSADYVPPSWSFSTTFTTTGPYGGNSHPPPGEGVTYSINEGNIYAVISGIRNTFAGTIPSITGLSMNTYAFSPWTGEVGNFSSDKNTFDLTVTLTDKASGASGSLVYHGGVGGSYTVGRYDQHASEFGPGYDATNLTYADFSNRTQSLRLGKNLYTVSLFPYLPSPRAMNMSVEVSSGSPVSTVPEPSTLSLAVTGLAGLGLRAWRRCRTRLREQPAE